MKTKFTILVIILMAVFLTGCHNNHTSPEEEFYTVNFYDFDGNIIKTQRVKQFDEAIAPISPKKDGYIFIKWSQGFSSIVEDLDVKPIYEKIEEKEYTVKFYVDGLEISTQIVTKGDSANEPDHPILASHVFKEWDKDFTNVQENLKINAIYDRISYVSYQNSFSYPTINSVLTLVNNISKDKPNKIFSNIFEGGYRLADQIHFYNEKNKINRNVYGFEVAINKDGIVVDKGTLVEIPLGGFILSGHSTTALSLQNGINIGDLVIYNSLDKSALVYRDKDNSSIIYLNIKIEKAVEKINEAIREYKALDYQLINEKLNKLIGTYNHLTISFDDELIRLCDRLLLDIDFLLIETKPVQTNAVWHYPLKSGNYYERNLIEVQILLNEYQKMGINRIYLNTNFNGRSIYKSNYLSQSLTNYYTYEGYKDYLECFIEEAHKRNIKVVAWTNTLIAGDGANNKFYSDRGWILNGYNGEDNFNGMYFVDISNPEVQLFLKNVFSELSLNYNLDGIEFDFIRYPNSNLYSYDSLNPKSINDSGYTDSFINAFKAKYNFDGDLKKALLTDPTLRNDWLSFKTELLNQFVRELTETIKTSKAGISISAAVMPDISTARKVYLQDWEYWIQNGWIDTLEPMIYSGDTAYVIETLRKMYEVVDKRANIVVGIFPEGSGSSASANADQIDNIINNFPVGWSKFSSKTIFNHSFLKDSISLINRSYTAQGDESKEKIYLAYILDLKEKVNGYYIYVLEDLNQLEAVLNSDEIINTKNYIEFLSVLENEINNITNLRVKEKLLQTHMFVFNLLNNDKI